MDGLIDSFQAAAAPGQPGSALYELLPASLTLIARDGRAATLATCIVLKAVFLALHLLAMRLPECSGMERLALVHWSFDVWNVWCLGVFVQTGKLPWSLETCVLYHVLGYLAYTLVYLHLYGREWARQEMVATPDSALETSASVGETERGEGEVERAAVPPGGEAFGTPSRGGEVESEDVPDEERVKRDHTGDMATDSNVEKRQENGEQTPAESGESLEAGNVISKMKGRDALSASQVDKELNGLNGNAEQAEERTKSSGVPEENGKEAKRNGVTDESNQNSEKLVDTETPEAAVITAKKPELAAGEQDAPGAQNGNKEHQKAPGDTHANGIEKRELAASGKQNSRKAPGASSGKPAQDTDATGFSKWRDPNGAADDDQQAGPDQSGDQ